MNRPFFPIRGVIEGFYGPFYTFPERNDLIRFIGQHGYNCYIYAPKNDRQHRQRWREAYPAEVLEQFAATVAIARGAGVSFCYAISPIDYVVDRDFPALTAKLHSLYDQGVRSFSILVDDICCTLHKSVDCSICQEGSAVHAAIGNQTFAWLQALDPGCTLSLCPTYYHGSAPFGSYLHDLGAQLDPAIAVFYTGPEICSPTIAAADARDVGAALRRKPLIWDNYPVNDLAMRPELHLGPIRGRDAALHETAAGVIVNLMLQAQASKIPLLTFAEYFADPCGYAPWPAWQRALAAVGGSASFHALRAFAETSLDSCLGRAEPSMLQQLADAALADLRHGLFASHSAPVQRLRSYLDELDEHCYHLKYRMNNLRLRENLLPWIEALEDWIWLGKHALTLLAALERDEPRQQPMRALAESLELVGRQNKRSAGQHLLPLARFALEQAERQPLPPIDVVAALPLEPMDRAPGWRPIERSLSDVAA
jgi:hyaluronoglucosaminidase